MMTPGEKLAKYGPIVLECNSKSEPDKTHFVRCKDGVLSCNCKGWIFNRESPKRCKHTDRAGRVLVEDRLEAALATTGFKRVVARPKVQKEPIVRAVRKITFDD